MSSATRDENGRPGSTAGFWALVATQFQGAFNDNAFKMLITLHLLNVFVSERIHRAMIPLTLLLFTLPYLIFSMYSGALADRVSKQRVIVWTKWLEIFIMLCGLGGFLLGDPVVTAVALLVTLFLMATQSAVFSPAKYGILPEILPAEKLSWGNGIIQMGTFVAIVTGTAVSGFLMEWFDTRVYLVSVVLVGLSVVGLFTSFGVSRPPAADPDRTISWWPWAGMGRYMKVFANDRWLLMTMIGIAYFWFIGAFMQQNILLFGKNDLLLDDSEIAVMQAALALGIGLGSVAAGYLSGGKIELGLIPLGSLGLALFSMLLAMPGMSFAVFLTLLFCLGLSTGFYVIPLSATLQRRSPPDIKGGMIATSNFVTFAGMTVSAGVFYLLASVLEVPSRWMFLIAGIMTVVMSLYICWLLPYFLLRFLVWMMTHTMYRMRVVDRENLPERGGALIVCNHMSFIDVLLLASSTDRQIRFLMYKGFYDKPLIRSLARLSGAISISVDDNIRPHDTARALDEAADAIRQGDVVAIFAEGQITRTGQMLPFRRGFERVMEGMDVPIVPVSLDRVWGSMFSFAEGKFFWKRPKRFRRRITVTFGEPMPADSSTVEVRSAVRRLTTESYILRKPDQPLLHRWFIRRARSCPRLMAVAEDGGKAISFMGVLAASIRLAKSLRPLVGPEQMVGVAVPRGVDGVLCNVALQLMGKVPVNLDSSLPVETFRSQAARCGIERVLTRSEDTVAGLSTEMAVNVDDLESTGWDKFVSWLMAIFCPTAWIERCLGAPPGRTQDDLCTVLFTSGSSGEPKGVMLSHFNVTSNIESVSQLFAVDKRDRLIGVLPFHQAFGFTVTLWLPLAMGLGVVYSSRGSGPANVGSLARRRRATTLVATPSMLQGYVDECHSRDFGGLTHVVTGGEALSETLSDAFEEKFGLRPLEGYGCTECAPVLAVSVPDYRAPGYHQVGHKRDRIGHPVPGVSVRIVDPESFSEMPVGEVGMLTVSGPNVMIGYLNDPEATADALRDGWFITGDMGSVDEDGFLTVQGRFARLSKIGGDTVPHVEVENALWRMAGVSAKSLVVVGVEEPDEENRLVVLHTMDDDAINVLIDRIAESDLPQSWRPHQDDFRHIPAIPRLPSGKIDYRGLKQLAEWTA